MLNNVFLTPAQIRGKFKNLVFAHLEDEVSDEKWQNWRSFAKESDNCVRGNAEFQNLSKFDFVMKCSCESNLDLKQYQIGKAKVIGHIADAPVFFIADQGIYLTEYRGNILDIWLSWPAYPPGW